jgi:hypothetical protein
LQVHVQPRELRGTLHGGRASVRGVCCLPNRAVATFCHYGRQLLPPVVGSGLAGRDRVGGFRRLRELEGNPRPAV